MLQKARQQLTKGVSQINQSLLITHGKGSYVYGQDGGKFLDFTCGIGVTNLGHSHPRVIEAAKSQLDKITHAQLNIGIHDQLPELMDRLGRVMPHQHLDTFMFANSGSEAVENAIKIARLATGKQKIIAFRGGFHGRTMGAMALTTSDTVYSAGFSPLMPGVHVAPFPYQLRMPQITGGEQQLAQHCLQELDCMMQQEVAARDVAAMIIEPVLGEGGYVHANKFFMRGLRERCNKYNIVLVADEVQSGFGRTGVMFAVAHKEIQSEPDMMLMAKGIANGMPLSCVVGRKNLMDLVTSQECHRHKGMLPAGRLGGTYGGNPVACAAANATLKVFEDENILPNVNERGRQLIAGLKQLQSQYPDVIQEVRGLGLMVAVEFYTKHKGLAKRISLNCSNKQNLLLLKCSTVEVMRFIPPLTVSHAEIEEGLHKFAEGLKDCLESH